MSVEAADETPVRAGTPPTFDDFVHAHADRLLRLSLLLSGDRGTAEDAVQEALSRACPRWERISRAHDPLAYVRRMVINAHHTWWRSVGRRERPSAVLPEATYADAADAAQLAAGARRTSVGRRRRRAVTGVAAVVVLVGGTLLGLDRLDGEAAAPPAAQPSESPSEGSGGDSEGADDDPVAHTCVTPGATDPPWVVSASVVADRLDRATGVVACRIVRGSAAGRFTGRLAGVQPLSSEQVAALSAVGRAAPRGYFDCGLPRRFATYRLVDPRGTVKPVELSPCQSPGINAMIAWLENRVDLREPGIEPADADIGAVPRAVLVEGERLVVTGPGSTGCPFDVEGIRRRRRTLVVEPVRHDACRTDFRPGTVEIDPSELDLDEVDEVRLAGSAAFDSGPFIRYDPQMLD